MNTTNRQEFIGSAFSIVDSPNKVLHGLTGTIIDETMHTFITQNNKHIPKKHTVFTINTPCGTSTVDGSAICQRPEDRIMMR